MVQTIQRSAVYSVILHRVFFLACLGSIVFNRQPDLVDVREYVAGSLSPDAMQGSIPLPGITVETNNRTSTWNNSTLNMTLPTDGVIFYNAFVPKDSVSSTENAMRIIRDQISQIRMMEPNTTIRYILIYNDTRNHTESHTIDQQIQDLCQPHCVQHAHLTLGNEINTLQAMWEYCSSNDPGDKSNSSAIAGSDRSQNHHEDERLVTYLHNKGSYHSRKSNDRSRKVGTHGALKCRPTMVQPTMMTSENMTEKNPCTSCSFRFQARPHFHVRANMWTAKCSFIRKLLPPFEYGRKLRSMYEYLANPLALDRLHECMLPTDVAANSLGLGRFAYERWIVSHPHSQPCETYYYPSVVVHRTPYRSASSEGNWTDETFQRLAGRLFEWDYIYPSPMSPPPNASWVWDFYKGFEDGSPDFKRNCKNETSKKQSALMEALQAENPL